MLFLKLLSLSCFVLATGTNYDYDDPEYDPEYTDYLSTDDEAPAQRVRRYPVKDSRTSSKKLSEQEMREVRDAVKQLLANFDEKVLTDSNTLQMDTRATPSGYQEDPDDVITPLTHDVTKSQHDFRKQLVQGNQLTLGDLANVSLDVTTFMTTLSTIPTARWPIDVPALLDLIAVLAADYETNLTKKLNESLIEMSIPTCETFTPHKLTTSEYDANATGTVIAKCFVCGLEEEGIPRSAPCADAFAGDFLPLVPVDPTARAQISNYRKYCKYLNIQGYQYNESQPRAVFGRWTGGCGVRWVDLTGVYTQRTCRSRHRAAVGRHYASKRMARLEMALMTVDNGCIVSPMATLLPLSRGISLFARFHACVCTGSWCNTSKQIAPWTSTICVLLLLIRLHNTYNTDVKRFHVFYLISSHFINL